jgi:hypothetical protein
MTGAVVPRLVGHAMVIVPMIVMLVLGVGAVGVGQLLVVVRPHAHGARRGPLVRVTMVGVRAGCSPPRLMTSAIMDHPLALDTLDLLPR